MMNLDSNTDRWYNASNAYGRPGAKKTVGGPPLHYVSPFTGETFRYMGPGTDRGYFFKGVPPSNSLDYLAQQHDICYMDADIHMCRRCDEQLLEDLQDYRRGPNPLHYKLDSLCITALVWTKCKIVNPLCIFADKMSKLVSPPAR